MLKKLYEVFLGTFSALVFIGITAFSFIPFFFIAVAKLIPVNKWRLLMSKQLTYISWFWWRSNSYLLHRTRKIEWQIEGLQQLPHDASYLIISNHQSTVDIPVLLELFTKHIRIPFMRFFLKKQLRWVPLLGFCWWALDYPFMQRYSQQYLAKHPELKGKDLDITRKACEKFKKIPVSIMNFVEGTRFSLQKCEQQQSPFKNLLLPKAGGVAFAINAMGEQLKYILNVTIIYPEGIKSTWDLLCGRIHKIKVNVQSLPFQLKLLGDYFNDAQYQQFIRSWLNQLWEEKQTLMSNERI